MTHLNFRNTFGFGICAALLFALALLNPAVAQEDTSAQPDNETESMAQGLLDTIHRFRLRNFMALNHYYNYTTDPDEALASQINDEMDASQDLISRIQELAGESLTGTELDDLSQAYQNFSDQMDTNIEDMRSSGYPDLRLLSDMANQAQNLSVLSGKLYNRVAEQDQTPTAEKVELAREASVTMALMVTRYSARSSSSVAQVFQGQTLKSPWTSWRGSLRTILSNCARTRTVTTNSTACSPTSTASGSLSAIPISITMRKMSRS